MIKQLNVLFVNKPVFFKEYFRLNSNAILTLSNGNIFHVTGPLCGEFTGHW